MRPFGKTDIDFITSGRFAGLENATKAVYHVITGIVSFHTGQFFHSVDHIADLAGYSHNSVDRALAELLDQKVISIVLQRPGETTVYRYNFVADGADRGGYSTIDPRPIPNAAEPPPPPMAQVPLPTQLDPQPGPPMSQPWPTGGSPPDPCMGREQELFNEIKTTTAADRISSSLIKKMISRYGEKRVNPVVVSMRSMNGEVKDANAYFSSAVMQGYIPTSKKARKKLEEQERKKAAEKRREEERRKRELKEEQFRRESEDPEAQRRIKAEMDKIFGILNESES